ncbi:MAG TPA: hypothetical protein VN783_15845 [Thermoanaerobaculia bacterium]|nr:hypothetical protein [Thermoanaerobaculia bacterium]
MLSKLSRRLALLVLLGFVLLSPSAASAAPRFFDFGWLDSLFAQLWTRVPVQAPERGAAATPVQKPRVIWSEEGVLIDPIGRTAPSSNSDHSGDS